MFEKVTDWVTGSRPLEEPDGQIFPPPDTTGLLS
jgi:hypothetical protein